jgi:GNAT superfamily N-acetyltransferase
MILVDSVDPESRAGVARFVDLAYRLYDRHPLWVPPLRRDIALMLNARKHPFYERSAASFFVAARDGRDVGRLAVLEHRPSNEFHGTRDAWFYLFESEDDQECAAALFARACEWAHRRGLSRLVGPRGFSALDGYGILVAGFEHRPMMTMANYNRPHYGALVERLGFSKVVDFESYRLGEKTFVMPERVRQAAERARSRGSLRVVAMKSRYTLVRVARRIGEAYNRAFTANWEYYPLSPREIDFLVRQLILLASPRLIKLIAHGDDIVGFLFAFPDVSAALQRACGRLTPRAVLDLLRETRRTEWVAMNGAGILPAYQGRGGNALLYTEMERTIRESRYGWADLPQVAESAIQMRRDLSALGAVSYKRHRIYGGDT